MEKTRQLLVFGNEVQQILFRNLKLNAILFSGSQNLFSPFICNLKAMNNSISL